MLDEIIDVVIADDDENALGLLEDLLEMEDDFNVVAKAVDGEDLINAVLKTEPNLAIVDISMPKLTGFEAIQKCIESQPDLKVIFVTGITDRAADAFLIDAVDYVVKPMEPRRLQESLAKAKNQITASERLKDQEKEIQFQQYADQLPKKLMIQSQYSITLVPLKDIIFVQKEKNGKKSFIYTKEKVYEINDTVSSLLNKMDFQFIKTHRSYIVNVNFIKEIVPRGAIYNIRFNKTDKEAIISKKYVQRVIHYLEKYLTIQRDPENGEI
ncbi:LytR/AlgR family response regulator transcription factor [Virgibacillus halodenitrificans]|uniref:LytR/AlgR family response regulator transcription factor n=1 Tax=Virgibacillus halodenitrificans TaxID=1482 RepID=UPI000EF47CEB|nr:LytTR family DNA-binding domain-containing protein [Virgibacillus halodenitrificans]